MSLFGVGAVLFFLEGIFRIAPLLIKRLYYNWWATYLNGPTFQNQGFFSPGKGTGSGAEVQTKKGGFFGSFRKWIEPLLKPSKTVFSLPPFIQTRLSALCPGHLLSFFFPYALFSALIIDRPDCQDEQKNNQGGSTQCQYHRGSFGTTAGKAAG